MKTILILTMHGAPPNDFPRRELGEFFSLHTQFERAPQRMDDASRQRYLDLNRQVRAWPRTPANDPFHASSLVMAHGLAAETGLRTLVCFNEFCDPGLSEAVKVAVEDGAQRLVILTPMMTGGGEHAEVEIPAEIEGLRAAYPLVEMIYAWPFDPHAVSKFLAGQVQRFI